MKKTNGLTQRQHARKEKILTQSEPAKVRETASATVLKQGSVYLLSTPAGEVPERLPHGFGLFSEDCRFLDRYTLTVNGRTLTALSNSDVRGFETHHHLANPELPDPAGGGQIPRNTVAVHRRRLIRGGVFHERTAIRNYGRSPVCLRIELRFRSRFEDLFVLKGFVSNPRGTLRDPRVRDRDTVELSYDGCDGVRRTTTILFGEAPDELSGDRACWEWTLEPGSGRSISVTITPQEHAKEEDAARTPARPGGDPDAMRRWLQRLEERWQKRAATIRSSNELFDRVLQRSLLDLRLLRSRLDGLHYFAAGVPWFVTLFGRDSATVAIQTMPYGQHVAGETLRLLARYQAQEVDAYRDAEPGKILHEFRSGELAQAGAIPQSPAYYGTVDATLLFIILMAEYVNWSGDLALIRSLRPALDRALGWIDTFADHNGDGYLDYVGGYENGMINQGWKDAGNSIVNADGSFPKPPIALCEVQSYAYRARRQAATLLRHLGDPSTAEEQERQAARLRERFERDFWSDDLGCYQMALQAGGVPTDVVSSNAGQVLWGGIAAPERARRVAERLMQPDMFSGWGVRTLSSGATAYNPVSYHLGSVWPHDNGLIAAGLRRYGQDEPALRIFGALFQAAANFRDERLPELFCGFERGEEQAPIRYPVACSPQAWAAGSLPHTLWTLLGLRADALERRLRVVRPRLPASLDWLEIEGVPVGDAVVDLRFEREGSDGPIRVRPTVHTGRLDVVHSEDLPAPDDYR